MIRLGLHEARQAPRAAIEQPEMGAIVGAVALLAVSVASAAVAGVVRAPSPPTVDLLLVPSRPCLGTPPALPYASDPVLRPTYQPSGAFYLDGTDVATSARRHRTSTVIVVVPPLPGEERIIGCRPPDVAGRR